MRYMSPSVMTRSIAASYAAPYAAGPRAKASVARFAHIVPGLPDALLLGMRRARLWRLAEGVLIPGRLTNVNAQARLAEMDKGVREWWGRKGGGGEEEDKRRPRVKVVFVEDDPLLKDFKGVLERTIAKQLRADGGTGMWIPGAGHYTTEEKPDVVAEVCNQWLAKLN